MRAAARLRPSGRMEVFVALVIACGVANVGLALAGWLPGPDVVLGPALVIAIVLAAVGEAFPVEVQRRRGNESFDTSSALTLGLVLSLGTAAGVIAQIASVLLASMATPRPPIKAAFNMAQKSVALTVAGAASALVASAPVVGAAGIGWEGFAAAAAAGIGFIVVNSTAVSTICALSQGEPLLLFARREIGFMLSADVLTLALAPLAATLIVIEPLLLPLLGIPGFGAWLAGRQAAQSHMQSRRDALTGLPNRIALREALDVRRGAEGSTAIVLLDLDGFSVVNDTFGHDVGDKLLSEAAERIAAAAGPDAYVGRLQGDEFGILFNDADLDRAVEAVGRLQVAFEPPFGGHDQPIALGLTAGIAAITDSEPSAELLRRADVAMLAAKHARKPLQVYTRAHDGTSADRLILLGSLRSAIAERHLRAHFQPQVDLTSGLVVGAEALVRWQRPDGRLIPPSAFVPAVESTALIWPMTLHVLDCALEAQARWATAGRCIRVAVNVSATSLLDERLLNEVAARIGDQGVAPGMLEIELTESAILVDPDRAEEMLGRLAGLGVRVSLDDFGIGYSSLERLSRLTVHTLKIDRSFVTAFERGEHNLVRTIVSLARDFDLSVVAEGIETVAVRDALAGIGCDVGQGFLWSPAVPWEDFPRIAESVEPAALSVSPFS